MKKYFILSTLISFTMICSCQKQDSTAEQQLAQRKTELDTREDVLIEREKALDERVNALAEKVNALDERVNALAENEKAAANAGTIPPAQSSDTISDPTQAKAERDRKIQEIAAEFRAYRDTGVSHLICWCDPDTAEGLAALAEAARLAR